jgi:D-amino peptidase
MASGDDVFVQETHALMPWVRYVETKSAGGFGSGTSLSPAAAREAIAAAAASAVTCTLQTLTPAHADLFCQWPTLERRDGVTLSFQADSVQAAVRMLNCLSAMSFMLK